MKKTLGVATLAVALSTVAYLLQRDGPTSPPVLAKAEPPPTHVELSRQTDLQGSEKPVPEPERPVVPPPQLNVSELPPPQPLSNLPVGFFREMRTIDFNRHLVFMGFGGYVEQNEPQLLKQLQQQYDLSDGELRTVVDYSVSALRSDRDYQKSGGRSICSRRSAYQSLHDFGIALNQLTRDTKTNQERLGREAEAALGVELFGKINNHLLREPPQEITEADFASVFAARDSNLETEIDRFCSSRALLD